jgi:hypothetical protein
MLQALQESIRDFIRDIGLTNLDENQPQQGPPDHDDENNHDFDWIIVVYTRNIYRKKKNERKYENKWTGIEENWFSWLQLELKS